MSIKEEMREAIKRGLASNISIRIMGTTYSLADELEKLPLNMQKTAIIEFKTSYLSCDECGKMFETIRETRNHIEKCRKNEYICEICGNAFEDEYDAEECCEHYHCEYCGKAWKTKVTQ